MAKIINLNTDARLEVIFLSITKQNCDSMIDLLLQSLTIDSKNSYDQASIDKISKFYWLCKNRLNGEVPSIETLKKEFPELIFDNVTKIDDDLTLSDYIAIYCSTKKQQYISNKFMNYADTVRSQGLSDVLVEDIYKAISVSEIDTDFSNIKDSFLSMYDNQVVFDGISFQCSELDKLTGGLGEGQLCTVLGASGSMKTTYTSNLAFGALKKGKNVLYLTLEESPFQLYCKWLSRASVDVGKPLPAIDIIQHKLEKKDLDILENEVKPYLDGLDGKVYFVGEQDLSSYALTSLESTFKSIDRLAIEETGHGIDLVVVDHIQLIKFAVTSMDPTTVINMYVSFFRQQSLSWLHSKRAVSIILLSQANRDGATYAMRHDGMYLATHVAEASEVIRASAYIISVYTDANTQVSKQLKIGAVKLRGSQLPTTTMTVYADGAYYHVGDDTVNEQMEYTYDDAINYGVTDAKPINASSYDPGTLLTDEFA